MIFMGPADSLSAGPSLFRSVNGKKTHTLGIS